MADIEQQFIDRMNADPENREIQRIYADLLDDLGDPRAEAWRVLIDADRFPGHDTNRTYWYWWYCSTFATRATLSDLIPATVWFASRFTTNNPYTNQTTFVAAMHLVATIWVIAHRDPDFDPTNLYLPQPAEA